MALSAEEAAAMIHPDNADEAADRLLMLIGDLGVGLADLASAAVRDGRVGLHDRFDHLGRLGADIAALAAAGTAVLANRTIKSEPGRL